MIIEQKLDVPKKWAKSQKAVKNCKMRQEGDIVF